MKVFLTVPSTNVQLSKGIAKASYELIKHLKKYVTVETYEVFGENRNYLKSLINVPIKQYFSNADVFHALIPELGAFLPYLKINSIVTFHDFIPLMYNLYGQ